MHDRVPDDSALAERLEAYARARLSPDPAAIARIRSAVIAAAAGRAARGEGDDWVLPAAALTPRTPPARDGRAQRSPWRRSSTLLLAAGLTLAIGVGSVAAAQPGGPLYPARVWSETLTLPAEANARAEAQVRRLHDRLAEAAAASAAGDTNAASAALEAYEAIVGDATTDAGNDVSAAATLESGVRSNIDVLTVLVDRMADRGNEQASEAIQRALERAIDRSDSALDRINGKPEGTPGNGPDENPGNGPGANPGNGPDANPGNGPNVNPGNGADKSPNPNKPSPDPADKTPRPKPDTGSEDSTTNAQQSPSAAATPHGRPSGDPPGQGGPPAEPPGQGGGANGNNGGQTD